MHGFDEWFGNLYHLNAEEEPEELDYPGQKNPAYLEKMGPRGVLHTWATDVDDPTADPKFGRVGKQKIENTGPLTRKRMETFDGEVLDQTLKWLDKNGKGDKPFFAGSTRRRSTSTRTPPKKYIQMAVDEGRAEEDVVRAKMIEHDEQVGALLKKLDDLGVADNTIVIYTTDNGNELMLWPDGGYAPFRGEKGTTWEGGVRVPMLVKWPGKIKPGSVSNGIQNHEDLFATLAAAAGLPNLKEELLTGKKMGEMTYKVHLDGYNNLAHWTGKTREVGPPRDLLLRRDRSDGLARGRLEDAHRREEGGQLVEREVLPQHPVSLQPADGPDGEDGPGVARVGLPRAAGSSRHKMWALNCLRAVHRGAPEEPDGIPAEPGRRHAEHQEGAGRSAGRKWKAPRGDAASNADAADSNRWPHRRHRRRPAVPSQTSAHAMRTATALDYRDADTRRAGRSHVRAHATALAAGPAALVERRRGQEGHRRPSSRR